MKIKIAQKQDELVSLLLLRKDVFINEQKVDYNLEFDNYDKSATHFIVLDNDNVIATCRIIDCGNSYKLGRFAVAKEYRKNKIGSKLLSYVENYARNNNIEYIELGAQIAAQNFYQQNGYKVTSETFYDANIPHKMMAKKL